MSQKPAGLAGGLGLGFPASRAYPAGHGKTPYRHDGRELAHQIGSKPVTDWGHQAAKAEFEHRKFVWQRAAVVIAGIALVVATAGVTVGALHLVRLAK